VIPLKRKVELALCSFLSSSSLDLKGVPIVAGHDNNKRELPCIVVFAESSSSLNDALSSIVFDVQIKIFILTQIDDEDIEVHDRRICVIRDALSAVSSIRLALNRPMAEPDIRGIKAFHLYDLIEAQADEGRDERHFGEVLNYRAICQGIDTVVSRKKGEL
jgi:hypothetical protein